MPLPFAQSFLIDLLGSKFLLEPGQAEDLSRGIELALGDNSSELSTEKLLDALERLGMPEDIGVLNLLKTPLSQLWVRATLKKFRRQLTGLDDVTIIVVGLWANIKRTRRTAKVEARFVYWRDFIEQQLASTPCGKLNIIYIG